MHTSSPRNALAVPTRSLQLEDETLKEIVSAGDPLLLQEGWANCPAVGLWDFQLLNERAGDQSVEVEYYPNGRRDRACTFLNMRLGEYLDRLTQDPPSRKLLYLAEYPIERVVPTLLDQFRRPTALEKPTSIRELLFVGYDSITTAHYHRGRTQAILGQISGEKTVVLFPPKDLCHLEMNPWYSLRPNHSKLPWGEKDYAEVLSESPRAKATTPLLCTVRPGELLFIPDHWVHYVVSEGPSVSVTWFWESELGTGYGPGIRRDKWSACAKTCMQVAARVASTFGLQRQLVQVAARLGIFLPDEQSQVQDYLDRFGATLPSKQHTHRSH
ncbi:MAG: cupin-like domain-containing protein [Aureliella sp.]